tara:strand:+ start:595 stop:1704 length:1110 start_codon:yes stop_codon:yes gene_type:complete
MANQNIRTPKFYPDLIGYHRGRGSAIGAVTATDAGTNFVGLPSDKTVADLLDLKPLNLVTFDTSADTDGHVLCTFAFSTASHKQNYIAILNHNLATSIGKIRVFAGNAASDVTALNGANVDTTDPDTDAEWNNITTTEVVNADNINVASGNKSVVVTPLTDGTTVIKFTEKNLRYWAIQFEGNLQADASVGTGSENDRVWGSTDFTLGGIMIGESFEMPFSPDLELSRNITYDKVKIQESVGGQRYASATNLGRTGGSASKSPFSLATNAQKVYGGRITYDLNFSFLNSSELLPVESNTYVYTDDTVVSDIWNMTDGPTRPFIFCIDKDTAADGAESDFMFARFGQDSLTMVQVAHDHYNVSMRIEEEF